MISSTRLLSLEASNRVLSLDALRGLAIVWMTIYHFCFDLNHFGWLHQDLKGSPFWVVQRACIVALFLFCVGWSQAIRKVPSNETYLESLKNQYFWFRWGQITFCALLVSFGSFLMYPGTWIYFGILHSIAVMLLVILFVKPWIDSWRYGDILILLLGCVCVIVPSIIAKTWEGAPWSILGLAPIGSHTEDFVPLLPWFSLVCGGYAFGLNRQRTLTQNEAALEGSSSWFTSKLTVLGRYSLVYYIVHQPILIGILTSLLYILKGKGN